MKQILILGLTLFILFIFIFITYFYFYSESLIKFSTDDTLLSIYVNKEWIETTHLKQKLIDRNYGFFTKLNFKEALDCFIDKISSSFSKKDFIGQIYINLSYLDTLTNSSASELLGKKMVKVNFFQEKKPEFLFFESEEIDDLEFQPLVSLDKQVEDDYNGTLNFVLITKQDLETLEHRITSKIAIQKPIEKQVTLPDGSTFTEIIVDPSIFNFEKKQVNKIELSYYQDSSLQELGLKEIAIWPQTDYNFISNDLLLAENIINKEDNCFFNIQNKEFEKAIYFQIEDLGIKDILVIETINRINGCMNLQQAE